MEEIIKYFPNLSSLQKEQFKTMQEVYSYWNARINVISRKDIDELYVRHILHSLAIAKVISFNKNSEILDVGTGGGFPGIPLAIMFPEVSFHLIDTIGKKITVVNEVANTLKLTNVLAQQKRAENIKNNYDFIVSRAVTTMPEFVSWIKNNVKTKQNNALQNGILYLKGGDLQNELAPFAKTTIYPIKDFFTEDFFETKKIVHLPL
mgnify:CR=1 FL=1